MPTGLEDYEVLGSVGSGSYGSCSKIRRLKDNKVLIWKVVDYMTMTDAEKQMLVSEVNLLRELKHEHIVRYYDRIIDRRNSRLYIVMELCEGGDLADLIAKTKKEAGKIDEEFVWKICYQVACALKECHCHSKRGKVVMHRDLKPANVFLDSRRNVKLGDFGMARVLSHEASFAQTFVGTPYYMSPELMNGLQYNEKTDVWALGCMLYELCALAPPFQASSHTELANRICSGQYSRIPMSYSSDLCELIAMLLQVEGGRRPSIESLLLNPVLLRHYSVTCALCGRSSRPCSTSADAESQMEALRKREELLGDQEASQKRLAADLDLLERDLSARRTGLDRRQAELDRREKTLSMKERLVEERMLKAERLLEEYAEAKLRLNGKKTSSNYTSDSDMWDTDDDLSESPSSAYISPPAAIPSIDTLELRPVAKNFNKNSIEDKILLLKSSEYGMSEEERFRCKRLKYMLDLHEKLSSAHQRCLEQRARRMLQRSRSLH